MRDTLETLIGGLSESEIALTIKLSAHQIWLAGIGAYSITQAEGSRVFGAFVKEGEVMQAKTRKIADETLSVVADKTTEAIEQVAHVVEDGISQTLARLGIPSRKDIDQLSESLVELSALVHKLAKRRAAETIAD
jgi:poly(hydroxyalkanoate) granule-associated protein